MLEMVETPQTTDLNKQNNICKVNDGDDDHKKEEKEEEYGNGSWRTNHSWSDKLSNLFKEFLTPISIRLSTGSIICLIFLIVSFYIQYTIIIWSLNYYNIFESGRWAYFIIVFLLSIDGIICIIIHLRCIYVMHRRFQADVIAVYTYYNKYNVYVNNNNDDAQQSDVVSNDHDTADNNNTELIRCCC